MRYLIIDFEVFRFDTLLGVIIVDKDSETVFQTWSLQQIKKFYLDNVQNVWIGHNNFGYDNIILEAIIKNKTQEQIFNLSKTLTSDHKTKCRLPLITYDTMKGFYSLKTTECVAGKNISETPVDFELDRSLTEEERLLTESYNRDDLEQTRDNFYAQFDDFALRLDIIKEFNLSLDALNVTGTKLASLVLGAKAIDNIEDMVVETKLPKNLQVKNQDVLNFYLNEDFRKNKRIKVNLCECEHIIASGGIHAAQKKIHCDKALYFDVSGYYNLIMINYNLLPRTMPQKSKELYIYMYHEQLRLKKINPRKRLIYKTILLSVFGAMSNQYTDFYDPYHGSLVTITGELFLVDLLEKLEGKVKVIQSNTDGIIVVPINNDWSLKDEIIHIVEEWEQRTGFVIKKEEIYNLWQRDVNNYCFDDNGKPVVRGEAMSAYDKLSNPIYNQLWNAKEPGVIAKGMVDYLLYGITPEDTVENNKKNLIYFQYICKKMSFDYLQYEAVTNDGEEIKCKLQNVNRAFASNNGNEIGTIIKYKLSDGKLKKTRVQSLSPNVFVYNTDIRSQKIIDQLITKIDYQYYINRIYERLGEFVDE